MLAKGVGVGVVAIAGWIIGTQGDRDFLPYPLSHFDPAYFSEDQRYLRGIGYQRYVHKGQLRWFNPDAIDAWVEQKKYYTDQLKSNQTQLMCNHAVKFDIRFLKDINPEFFNADLVQSALKSIYGDQVWNDIDSVSNCVVGPIPKEVLQEQLQDYYARHEIAPEVKDVVNRLIEEDHMPRFKNTYQLDPIDDYALKTRTGSFRWWK